MKENSIPITIAIAIWICKGIGLRENLFPADPNPDEKQNIG